jgi:hypothetical protein
MVGTVILVCCIIVLINIPFGYLRDKQAKFSLLWFVAVHTPVFFVIGTKFMFNVSTTLVTLPLFFIAYFLGQYFGGKIKLTQLCTCFKNEF